MQYKIIMVVMASLVMLATGCTTSQQEQRVVRPVTLKVLSYNVYGYDPIDPARVTSLFELIQREDADIIAFQEASSWFLEALQEQEFVKASYYYMKFPPGSFPEGKAFTLSKFPIRSSEYTLLPGKTGRRFLTTYIEIEGMCLPVVNLHLASLLDDHKLRVEQMEIVFDSLDRAATALVAGDFNFGDHDRIEVAFLASQKKYRDVWRTLHSGKHGYTWNMEANRLARLHAYDEETSRRLDRILVKTPHWKPEKAYIIGRQAVEADGNPLYPSDHYGLVAVFTLLPWQ
jgi:endonuclease/exonuclease/phosphatase family metal-dependent hydrolase